MFFGYTTKHGCAIDIHEKGYQNDAQAPPGRVEFGSLKEKAFYGFMDDPAAGDEQENRFCQRGKIFDLAISVGMCLVGGTGRHTYGKAGDARGDEIKPLCRASERMPRLFVAMPALSLIMVRKRAQNREARAA